MARTDARRQRDKKKLDPSFKRGSWGDVDPVEKKLPTMLERQQRKASKYKPDYLSDWED